LTIALLEAVSLVSFKALVIILLDPLPFLTLSFFNSSGHENDAASRGSQVDDHIAKLEETSEAASKEYFLEKLFDKMLLEWEPLKLEASVLLRKALTDVSFYKDYAFHEAMSAFSRAHSFLVSQCIYCPSSAVLVLSKIFRAPTAASTFISV
jgi:hypothetical protein